MGAEGCPWWLASTAGRGARAPMPGAPHSHALGAARARVPRRALRFEGRAPTGRSRSQSSCLSSPAASRRFILPFSFFFFFFFLRAFPAAASAEAPPSPPSSSPPAAAPRDVLSRRSSSVAQTPAHTQTACTSRLARPRRPAAARAACAGAVVRHEVEVGEALAGRRPACRSTAVSHAQRS